MENNIKTPLNEEPFGIRSMERFDVGDLVRWTELNTKGTDKVPRLGIIYELFFEKRGNRNVALAIVHEVTNSKQNISVLGRKVEVLAVCLDLVSKITVNNV